jgi:hypothetical protein
MSHRDQGGRRNGREVSAASLSDETLGGDESFAQRPRAARHRGIQRTE